MQNAAIPLVTLMGSSLETTIGGAAVIENVFNIPGLGSYMVWSVGVGDYPAVQGTVLVFSALVCVINFTVDILYGYIDPRIKAKYSSSSKKRQKATQNTTTTAKEES